MPVLPPRDIIKGNPTVTMHSVDKDDMIAWMESVSGNSLVFANIAECQAREDMDASVNEITIGGRRFVKVAGDERNSLCFLHPNGNYYSGVQIDTANVPILLVTTGQSGAQGLNGALGGDTSVADNVAVFEQFPPSGLEVDRKWEIGGPQDLSWPLRDGNAATIIPGSYPYEIARAIAKMENRLVCIVMQFQGGTPVSQLQPGGQIWIPLQAAFQNALTKPLPRRTQSLTDLNVAACHILNIDIGEADADYRSEPGPSFHPDASPSADAFVIRYNDVLMKMLDGAGEGNASVPIIDKNTEILTSMLTPGGASGGNSTDDRNDQIRLFACDPRMTLRDQIRVIDTTGLDVYSTDSIHIDGIGLPVKASRALKSLRSRQLIEPVALGNWEMTLDGQMLMNATRTALTINAGQTVTVTLPFIAKSSSYSVSIEGTAAGQSDDEVALNLISRTTSQIQIQNTDTVNAVVVVSVGPYAVDGAYQL